MSSGLTPKLPLTIGNIDNYVLITTYVDLVKQNFKNLMLTNPGERIMNADFGVGLSRFLFSPNTMVSHGKISGKIKEQASKYLPYINVENIAFDTFKDQADSDPNFLKVIVSYRIVPLETVDRIEITLPTN